MHAWSKSAKRWAAVAGGSLFLLALANWGPWPGRTREDPIKLSFAGYTTKVDGTNRAVRIGLNNRSEMVLGYEARIEIKRSNVWVSGARTIEVLRQGPLGPVGFAPHEMRQFMLTVPPAGQPWRVRLDTWKPFTQWEQKRSRWSLSLTLNGHSKLGRLMMPNLRPEVSLHTDSAASD